MRPKFWVGFALSCAVVGPLAAADEPAREASRSVGKAFRTEKNGWIFVHLEGSPEDVGYQHGWLLSSEIADLIRVCKPFLEKTSKRNWGFYRHAAETMLWAKTDSEYQHEIDGIVAGLKARGVEADRWDLLALNALEELPYYYVPWLDKKEGKAPATHAPGNCSAFIATGSATKDGRIVMGHNAWTNYVVGSRWNIIFDIKPQYGFRILMDGLPGIITSDDDFGINEVGLMVTETTITQFEGWDCEGKPEFARARKALQYSRSIDEYTKIMLDGNNGGYANDWLIGDAKTGEIALFELGLKNSSLRRTKEGCFFGSNFPVDPKLTAEETKFDVNKKESSPNARKLRWEQLVAKHKGAIDVELGKEFETDDFDVIDGKHGANDRTLCGQVEVTSRGVPEWDWGPFFPGGTVQSKVTDSHMAQALELWVQVGHHGNDFLAEPFLCAHPEYAWMRGLLKDMRYEPWTKFKAASRP
jgi:hypothetical protein